MLVSGVGWKRLFHPYLSIHKNKFLLNYQINYCLFSVRTVTLIYSGQKERGVEVALNGAKNGCHIPNALRILELFGVKCAIRNWERHFLDI